MPREYDAHFGSTALAVVDWRGQPDFSADDDALLEATPPDVVAVLGFDPLDLEKANPYHDELGRFAEGPGGRAFDPDPPTDKEGWSKTTIFHGTGADLRQGDLDKPLYLTGAPDEAGGFAEGRHLGGSGGKPKVYEIRYKPGRTVNIQSYLDEALESGDDFQDVINQQIRYNRSSFGGTRYLTFMHPGFGGEDFQAVISLHPDKDLKIVGRRVAKANPYHDERGRFAEAPGGAVTGARELTAEEKDTIGYYTAGQGYSDINGWLRTGGPAPKPNAMMVALGGSPKTVEEHVAVLDKAINAQRLASDTTVFRGFHDGKLIVAMEKMARAKRGKTFTDKGFVSTSTSETVAQRFSPGGDPDLPLGYLMEIRVPKGTPALPASAMGLGSPLEAEVILGRNTKFRVDGREQVGNKVRFKVSVVK